MNKLDTQIFQSYKNCFFCNSENLGKKINYIYNDNQYTIEIRKQNSLSVHDIQSSLNLRECNQCKSLTFDKWFNHRIYIKLYKSKHRMGWYKFLNTIYQNNSEIVEEDIKTFKKLTQEINTIENYVELGCPFVGMFPLFSLIKQQNNNSENKLSPKKDRLKFFFLRILKKKKFNQKIYLDLKKLRIPYKNTFVEVNSNLIWADNCNNFGCNCKSALDQFNWINSSNLDTLSPLQKIDLLYLSNTLDHLQDPFATLSKISSRVKNIYIKCHDNRSGAQHPYFLQKDSMNYIATELNLKLKIFGVDNEYLLTS